MVRRSCPSSSSLCLFCAVTQQLGHCYQFLPLPAASQGGLSPLWAEHILSLISTVPLGTRPARSAPASAVRAADPEHFEAVTLPECPAQGTFLKPLFLRARP